MNRSRPISQSDAFINFFTLLLGLGMAVLLTRFADVLRRKPLRDIGLTGLLLAALIIFEFLSGWAGAYRTFAGAQVNIAALMLPFATGACYFMASVLLLPEPAEIEGADIDAHISAQVRRIAFFLFAANLLLIGAELPFIIAKRGGDVSYWAFYVPYNGSILACYGAMMAIRSRRIAMAAMVVLILIYLWVTVTQKI